MDNKGELSVFTVAVIFVLLISVVAYFTVGEPSYGYVGEDGNYTDPLSGMSQDYNEVMSDENYSSLVPDRGWFWNLPVLSTVHDALSWAGLLADMTSDNETVNIQRTGVVGVSTFAGAFWNVLTINIPALDTLGLFGMLVKVTIWMVFIYAIIKLLPFT